MRHFGNGKLIYTSNELFKYKEGQEGECFFDGTKFWMDNFHTSYVKEAKSENNILTLKTRNSEYKFEIENLDFNLNIGDVKIKQIEDRIKRKSIELQDRIQGKKLKGEDDGISR